MNCIDSLSWYTMSNKYGYWNLLRRLRDEYMRDHVSKEQKLALHRYDSTGNKESIDNGYYYWIQHTYGIKPHFNSQGQILESFDVVDEKLYMFCKLKHPSIESRYSD